MPIEWFVTTASQSRIWLKLLSDDSNKVGICLLCRSTQLHATTSCRSQVATTCDSSYVLQSSTPYWKSTTLYSTPVLLCTTKYYTPVLLCTTKYYSSTTLYYTVLLQYYSVLQSTTPVLLCTTKYYSSTTLYYKVLLQYYSVLQSINPVLLCTTKYYSVLQSTTPVLLLWMIRVTYETLFTMCGTAEVLLQHHRLLRLPRKMTLRIDPRHIWNVIYNARSNRDVSPTSPNTAPATKSNTHHWSSSHMKRYLQCAEQQVSLSNLTKYCACHEKWFPWLILVTYETSFTMRGATGVIVQPHQILRHEKWPSKISKKFAENGWNVIYNARPIRPWSDHDPRMIRPWNRQSATRLATEVTFHAHHEHVVLKNTTFRAPAIIPNFTEYCASHEKWHLNFTKSCACHEKWMSWLILFTHDTLFTMRGATSVIVQPHQILRLPRKMIPMTDPCHIWNVIYNARSNRCHCPTSPNTAPATKNDRPKSQRNLLKTDETSFTMRGRSDHDPRMIRPWNRQSATRLRPPRAFCIEKYNISRSGYHSKFHRILRLPRKVTLELHQILRLPKSDAWTSANAAPATKSDTWTSPNTAPATKSDTWTSANRAMTWLSYDLTELWLDWAMTWLSYYLTELLLNWAMTWLSYDLTELWLDWAMTWLLLLDRAMTWLSYDLTELLLDWAMTWLSHYLTELWLDWAITWLSYYLTELWLDWAITELLLDWAITWLSYDFTELLLNWAMTWLSYDLTELWLDWAMTWLSFYLTELWLDWAMTWLSYDLTELWLDWAIT